MSNKSIIGSNGEKRKQFEATEQRLIFEMFRHSFDEAAANIGEIKEFRFEIAGETICLKFAGDALFPLLTKALSHLPVGSNQPPNLTFFLWDGLTTGRKLPVLIDVLAKCAYQAPWLTARGQRSELYDLSNGEILSALYGETILTSVNLAEKTGVYWASSAADIPYYEIGAPLRMPLSWHFSSPTRQILHSGAVGTIKGGVLLAGKGGSGKSTTALSCLDSPLFYASDDYLLVEMQETQTIGYSLFNTAKVKTNQDLARFVNLDLHAENAEKVLTDNEKPMMFLDSQKPEKLIRSLPLKAIVFPRYTAGETARFDSISSQDAFRFLVSSNVIQTPHLDKVSMQMMRELTKKLPAYALIFGENQAEIPNLILAILAENG
jgi:hypothetical protein